MNDISGTQSISDTQVAAAIEQELGRQRSTIELIASENIVSEDVMRY